MTKKYSVHWRTPSAEGDIAIETDNFNEIGKIALKALWPPKECPIVVTRIELINPEQYVNGLSMRQEEPSAA